MNIKRHDICRPFTQRRVYTTIGSRGIVFAKNDIFNYQKFNVCIPIIKSIIYLKKIVLLQDSFYKQCSMHILSCPSCMINIRFKDVDLTCKNDNEKNAELICNSICIVEPPYSVRSLKCVNGTVKNSSIHYKSLTSQVNLNFINRNSYNHAFTAEYLITSKYTY